MTSPFSFRKLRGLAGCVTVALLVVLAAPAVARAAEADDGVLVVEQQDDGQSGLCGLAPGVIGDVCDTVGGVVGDGVGLVVGGGANACSERW